MYISVVLYFSYIFIASREPARIERMVSDNSKVITLARQRIILPMALTLDTANQFVYWSDIHFDHIERINYDGADHTRFVIQVSLVRTF